jgi:hypothetical protein
MDYLAQALDLAAGRIHARLYEATAMIAQMLLVEGHVLPARMLLVLLLAANKEQPVVMEMMNRLNTSRELPLVLKDDRTLRRPEQSVRWKSEFQEALDGANRGQWLSAERKLVELAPRAEKEFPVIWWNIGMLRSWLDRIEGAAEAMRKFAAADVPIDDAVEAHAFAMMLVEDPLGDMLNEYVITYEVSDPDAVREALQASPRTHQLSGDMRHYVDEGEPPPQAVFALTDRPPPEPSEPVSADRACRLIGEAYLFGRQTDRAPRLELSVSEADFEHLKSLLDAAGIGALGSEVDRQVDQQVSWTRSRLYSQWRLSDRATYDDYRNTAIQRARQFLLDEWIDRPLGALDGKSPRQAADDETYRIRLMAVLAVVEFLVERLSDLLDLDPLRTKLGLPTLEPVDPRQYEGRRIPLPRLARAVVEHFSDEALLDEFLRASAFRAVRPLRRLAQEVVARPSLAKHPQLSEAYASLINMAEDVPQALALLAEARKATVAAGATCAQWDLLEFTLRLTDRDSAETARIMNHIAQHHLNEPGVAATLQALLIDAGLMRPDGSMPTLQPATAAQAEPAIVVPGQQGAEAGKIWTPDGGQSGEAKKIWTPGMD